MKKTPEDYLKELDQDMSEGLNRALSLKPAADSEQPNTPEKPITGKEILLTKVRGLIIALLNENKLDPRMPISELPAFLEDEMKKPE